MGPLLLCLVSNNQGTMVWCGGGNCKDEQLPECVVEWGWRHVVQASRLCKQCLGVLLAWGT